MLKCQWTWLLYLISFSQLCKQRPRPLVILLQKRKKKDISCMKYVQGSFWVDPVFW